MYGARASRRSTCSRPSGEQTFRTRRCARGSTFAVNVSLSSAGDSASIGREKRSAAQPPWSVNSSYKQDRYRDEQTPDGVLYRYQGDDPDNYFNRWLRSAHLLDVPIVYFGGSRPNHYQPIYPTCVEQDDPENLRVLLTFGRMRGAYDEREPVHIPDEIERRYVVREVKQRIHQAQFRGAVLPAYADRCAICRLREVRLLDAAHIVGDAEELGEPVVSNGLSLCSIHHRAFDQDLVGVAPNLRVHVSRRLLDDDDGPMLDVLKGFHGSTIEAPAKRLWQPDRDRLEIRFRAVPVRRLNDR
jgi:putative restriction endonuclease